MAILPKAKPPYKYNFAWEEHDFVYMGTAKCASQSMRQMLKLPARDEKPHIRSTAESWQYSTRLAVFRHPFNRFVSAWRYGWRSVPWDKFVHHVIRDPEWDIHTFPQYNWLSVQPGELTTFVPNVVVTLETLDRHWDTLRAEYMPWLDSSGQVKKNASPPLDQPPPTYRKEIEATPGYDQDLYFWEYLTNECDGCLGPTERDEVGRLRESYADRR